MSEMQTGMTAVAWVPMMAAMMLPGALLPIWRRRHAGPLAAAVFAGAYFAVWAAVALVIYELGEPHGTVAVLALVTAAVLYELSPLNRRCLARCRGGEVSSGLAYGGYCVGSSIALMAALVVLGPMEMTWMVVAAALALAQKLLPVPHLHTQGEPA